MMLLPANTTVHRLGRPIRIGSGNEAVLLLHGWTGWAGRLEYLAGRLAESGYTVDVPRLPGHGTNLADFLSTGATDWYRRALDAYLDLASTHERVLVAGTSMGAVLTVILATELSIDRIALLAPALSVTRGAVALAPLIRPFVRRVRSDWRPENESDPEVRELGSIYSTYNYVGPVCELLKLQRRARRALPELTSDTLVVVSRADPTVPQTVTALIEQRARPREFRKVLLDKSGHHVAEDVEREVVADSVVGWFARAR